MLRIYGSIPISQPDVASTRLALQPNDLDEATLMPNPNPELALGLFATYVATIFERKFSLLGGVQ